MVRKSIAFTLCLLFIGSFVFAAEVTVKTEQPSDNSAALTNIYYKDKKEVAKEKMTFDAQGNPLYEVTGTIPDGVVKAYYPNGVYVKASEEFTTRLSGDEGVKLPFKEGDLTQEENFKNNKRNGAARIYFNGKVSLEINYKDNNMDGLWKQYAPDGTLMDEGSFSNNKKVGLWKEYSGDVVEHWNYKDGKLDGPSKTYKNGKLTEEWNYKNDKIEGMHWMLQNDGTKKEIIIKDGKEISRKVYNPDGTLKQDQLQKPKAVEKSPAIPSKVPGTRTFPKSQGHQLVYSR